MSEQRGDVRELRLGLVCYGGVSLAIYMHGVAKELQSLVVASRALEEAPDGPNPFTGGVEKAYWEALREAARRDQEGVRTQVVVDVISGTSAGGINGVILAKALAHNRSQEPLTSLWFDRAAIHRLLGRRGLFPLQSLRILGGRALLQGLPLIRWLGEALDRVDQAAPPAPVKELATLMPPGHRLDLFVTTTDFFGYTRQIAISDPTMVAEKRHRHVFRFGFRSARGEEQDEAFDQLGKDHNPALAFAARATSSFPGAFPPVSFADVGKALGLDQQALEDIGEQFFSEYAEAGERPEGTQFVDGGVLDNKPFRHSVEAIAKKPASLEVRRRLLYIEPDPRYEPPDLGRKPGLVKSVVQVVKSIRGHEPILDDILEVQHFNERVHKVRRIMKDCRQTVLELVRGVRGFRLDATVEELQGLRQEIDRAARRYFGVSAKAYLLLRIHSVVEQFAEVMSREVCRFAPDSNRDIFTRYVVSEWAEQIEIYGGNGLPAESELTSEQEDFLDSFDIGYTRRRIIFVIRYLNELYGKIEPGRRPDRRDLDLAKGALYDELGVVRKLIAGGDFGRSAEVAHVGGLFTGYELGLADRSLTDAAKAFVQKEMETLDGVRKKLAPQMRERRREVRAKLYDAFRTLTAGWDRGTRGDILTHYLGFPFWDALIYPLQALSDVGELDKIEVVRMSPEESKALERGGTAAKLEGVGVAHFKAFLRRKYRENDYLWGRLDAAERLLGLIGRGNDPQAPPPDPELLKGALSEILDEEEKRLHRKAKKKIGQLRKKIAEPGFGS